METPQADSSLAADDLDDVTILIDGKEVQVEVEAALDLITPEEADELKAELKRTEGSLELPKQTPAPLMRKRRSYIYRKKRRQRSTGVYERQVNSPTTAQEEAKPPPEVRITEIVPPSHQPYKFCEDETYYKFVPPTTEDYDQIVEYDLVSQCTKVLSTRCHARV